MDVILDCYFDTVFCQLERSSLMVRYKRRQLVNYLNTVIQGCVLGEDCDIQTGVRRAVSAATRYHASTRSSNGAVCLMGKYHNILYVAAKLCYDWKLNDNPTVVQLLNDIYQCEHTFERLFIGAIFGTRVTHLISGWKSDFENSEENISAVEYFLKHATEAKLDYLTQDGVKTRFIDVPMESYGRIQPLRAAAQFSKDEFLLLLLRYGANIAMDYKDDEGPMEPSLRKLNAFCNSNVSIYQTAGPLACLKIILRAIPSIKSLPCKMIEENGYDSKHFENILSLNELNIHPKLLEDGVIPPSRSGFSPPELKHLCRCVIRDILRDSWQLPFGIRSLQIPSSLHDYLDLLED